MKADSLCALFIAEQSSVGCNSPATCSKGNKSKSFQRIPLFVENYSHHCNRESLVSSTVSEIDRNIFYFSNGPPCSIAISLPNIPLSFSCNQWVSQTDVPKCIHTRPESDKTSSILLKRGRFYLVAPSVKTFCFAL